MFPSLRPIALAVACCLGGCAAGPDFVKPAPPATDRYVADLPAATVAAAGADGAAQRYVAGLDLPGQWWALFRSPALNRLVEAALRANPRLPAAEAALRQAGEAVRAQRGLYFPQVQVGIAPTRQRTPTGTLASNLTSGDSLYNLVTAQVSVVYVPDVFGLNRRSVESLEAQADVQRAQLAATYVTLTTNLVQAAIQEASLRGQIAATGEIVALQQESLAIFRKQFALGAIAYTDVSAQETALAQARAAVPALKKQLAIQRDLIAALAGRMPFDEPGETFELAGLELPRELPLGVPARLVERRPDVRAAEAALRSASAQIGVAAANALPQTAITASWGGAATELASMFSSGNIFWGLGAGIAQTLFSGGTLQARKRGAEAAFDQAAAQYRGTVIGAFQNVADSLRALQYDAESLEALSVAERAAAQNLDLVRKGVELGAQSPLSLLIAQQALQQTRLAVVQARASRYADTVALFQSLGGGWWDSGLPALSGNPDAARQGG
jgi:NodT family efflux transporter outer membrane factor (OMF) lipoprotein